MKIDEAGRSKLNKTDTLLAPETAAPVLTSFEKTRKSWLFYTAVESCAMFLILQRMAQLMRRDVKKRGVIGASYTSQKQDLCTSNNLLLTFREVVKKL